MADGGFVMVDWIGVLIVEATTTQLQRRGGGLPAARWAPRAGWRRYDTVRLGSARLRSVCGH